MNTTEFQDNQVIEKTVKIGSTKNINSVQDDLEFWLSRSPEERINAVELLRRQYHGNTERLQRVARVIQQS